MIMAETDILLLGVKFYTLGKFVTCHRYRYMTKTNALIGVLGVLWSLFKSNKALNKQLDATASFGVTDSSSGTSLVFKFNFDF